MGNTMNVELKEGKRFLEIEETLIRNFQDRIYTVDKSMTSFVNAIDSTEAACEILLRRINNPESKAKENTPTESHSECKLDDTKLAAKLLWTIKECVSDHKFIVLECLSKLMHLVIDIGKTYTDCQPELSIDKYRNLHNTDKIPFYDARIETLQTELQLFRQNDKIEKDKVNTFIEKEKIYKRENEVHLKRIKDLDDTIKTLVSENEKLHDTAKKQSIQIDCLTKQEEQAKLEHEEMCRLVKEYNSKADKYLKEVELLIEEIINEYGREKFEENSKQQELQNIPLQSGQTDPEDSHIPTTENDTITSETVDVRMTKIKNQLTNVKEIFKTEEMLHTKLTGGENIDVLKLKQDKDEIERKNNEMRIEMDKLAIQLKSLKDKKIIYVQVYFEPRLEEDATERNLIGLLESRMRLMSIDLRTEELKDPSFVHAETPLLVICTQAYTYLNWGYSSAKSLVERFDDSIKMALVTFHRKERHYLIPGIQEEFAQKLRGIFDFGYKDYSQYDIDDGTINRIIAFIMKEGARGDQLLNSSSDVCKNELKVHKKNRK